MSDNAIITPHEHDVLSGRGNFVNYHAGNEHFRALVRKHKVAYVACPKPQKGKFSKMIYDEIRARDPPGRFLKQDAKTKVWYDIGEKKALDKTRQALREGAPEIQKELTGDADPCLDDDDIGYQHCGNLHAPAHHQQGLGFQNVSSLGMGNFSDGGPIPYDSFSSNGMGMNHQSLGMHPVSPHMSQQRMLQGNSGMLGIQSLGMGHSGNACDDSPIQMNQSLRHPGLELQQQRQQQHLQQQQIRHLQQQRQQLRQQQELEHQLELQQRQQQQGSSRNSMGPPALPSGLNLHGTRGNLNSRPFPDPSTLPSKYATLNHPSNMPNVFNGQNAGSRSVDPYHLGRNRNSYDAPNSPGYCDSDDVGPIHRRSKENSKAIPDLQGSNSSLVVDNIFSGGESKSQDSNSITSQSSLSSQTGTKGKGMNLSSHNMSVMSLTMDDMDRPEDDANQLSSLLNNSMRISNQPKAAPTRMKRASSVEGDSSATDSGGSSVGLGGSLLGALDMSVATLGDRMSDFGDGSMHKMMTDSQAEMSFGNVFEEAEKDLYVCNRLSG